MQTYQQFKEASARTDAILGEIAPNFEMLSPSGRRSYGRMRDALGGALGEKFMSNNVGRVTGAVIPALAASCLPWTSSNSLKAATSLTLLGSSLLGYPAALFTPTWDKKDVDNYKKSKLALLADYLVPGAAAYHRMKTVGYISDKYDKKD